jgi:hypothetical protein
MTYEQAILIVHNATSHNNADEIRKAACFVLESPESTMDDLLDAVFALTYVDREEKELLS